jgi:hypothetical protein
MGDFNITGPVIETVDRRGQSYETGRAGANTSMIGSFMTGAIDAAADVTTIRGNQLMLQDKYNPTRLAQESLNRDLENEKAEQAIIDATQRNEVYAQTGMAQAEANVDHTVAGTGSLRANTSKTLEDLKILRATGMENARADIASKYAGARRNNVLSTLDEKFGGMTRQSEAIERMGKAYKDFGGSGAGGPAGGVGQYSDLGFQDEGGQVVQPNNSTVPSIQNQQVVNQANNPQSIAQSAIAKLAERTAKSDELLGIEKTQRESYSVALGNKKVEDEIALNNLTPKYHEEAVLATYDKDNGQPNIEAGLQPVLKLAAATTRAKDPVNMTYRSEYLQSAIDAYGGPDEFLKGIDASSLDDAQKKAAKESFYQATALGKPEDLPPVQKDIFNAFTKLGPKVASKYISKPDDVYDMTTKLISNKSNEIEDSDFKKVMMTSDYIRAANVASKDGSQPFTFKMEQIEAGNPGDVSGASSSQSVMMFTGADGTTKSGSPLPENDEHYGVLGILDGVSKRSQEQAKVAGIANQTNQEIQGRQASSVVKPQAPAAPQGQTQAAPQGQSLGAEVAQVTPQEQVAVDDSADVATPANIDQADVVGAPAQEGQMTPATQEPSITAKPVAKEAPEITPLKDREIASKTIAPTAQEQAGRTVIMSNGSIKDEKALVDAQKTMGQYEDFSKQTQDEIKESQKHIPDMNHKARLIDEALTITEDYGLQDFLGTKGDFSRMITEVASKLPGSGATTTKAKQRLLEIGKQLDGAGVLEIIGRGVGARVIDTAKEREGLAAYSGNLQNGEADLKTTLQILKSDASAEGNINALKSKLLEHRVTPTESTRILNNYIKDFAREVKFNADGSVVENKKHMSAEEYMSKIPLLRDLERRRDAKSSSSSEERELLYGNDDQEAGDSETDVPLDQPAGSGANKGGILPPSAQSNPSISDSNEETAVKIAEKTGGAVPADKVQPRLDEYDQAKEQAPEESRSYIDMAKSIYANSVDYFKNGDVEKMKNLAIERSKQDPEFRKAVDEMKATLKAEGEDGRLINKALNFMTGGLINPKTFNTSKVLDNAVNGALFGLPEKIVSTVNEAKADVAQTAANLTGSEYIQDKATEFKVNETARQEENVDFKAENTGQALASDMVAFASVSGALKKASMFALGKLATKYEPLARSINFLTGATKATGTIGKVAQAGSVVGGVAVREGATNAIVGEGGTAADRFVTGAAIGGGLKAAGGIAKAVTKPVASGVQKLVKGPNPIEIAATLVDEKGGSGANLIRLIDEAKSLSSDKAEAFILGQAKGAERQVFQDVLSSPEGRRALDAIGSKLDDAVSSARSGSLVEAGLDNKVTDTKLTNIISKDLNKTVDKAISTATKGASKESKTAITKIINDSSKGIVVDVKKGLKEMNDLIGRKTTLPGKSGGTSLENIAENKLTFLKDLKGTINETLRGKDSVFKKLENTYKNGTVFSSSGAETLQKNLSRMLKEDRNEILSKTLNYVDSKLVGVPSAGNIKADTLKIQPTLKYMAELREFVNKGGKQGVTEIGGMQKSKMVKLIDDAIEKSFVEAGQDPGMYKTLLKQYGNLAKLEDTIEGQEKLFSEVANHIKVSPESSLNKSLFKGSKKEKAVLEGFGKAEKDQIFEQTKAYDKAQETLKNLASESGSTSRSTAGLGKDIETALKISGTEAPLGKSLIEAGKDSVAKEIKSAVSKENQKVLGQAVLNDMRRRADDFVANSGKQALDSDKSLTKQIFGMDTQKLNNAKQYLTKPQVELIDKYSQRMANINSMESLRDLAVKNPQNAIKGLTGFARRMWETNGRYILDIVSGAEFNALNQESQRVVVEMLTQPTREGLERDLTKIAEMVGKTKNWPKTDKFMDAVRHSMEFYVLADANQDSRLEAQVERKRKARQSKK